MNSQREKTSFFSYDEKNMNLILTAKMVREQKFEDNKTHKV
jgi:hypothetical protein